MFCTLFICVGLKSLGMDADETKTKAPVQDTAASRGRGVFVEGTGDTPMDEDEIDSLLSDDHEKEREAGSKNIYFKTLLRPDGDKCYGNVEFINLVPKDDILYDGTTTHNSSGLMTVSPPPQVPQTKDADRAEKNRLEMHGAQFRQFPPEYKTIRASRANSRPEG